MAPANEMQNPTPPSQKDFWGASYWGQNMNDKTLWSTSEAGVLPKHLKRCSNDDKVVRIKRNLLSVAPAWTTEVGWDEALRWGLFLWEMRRRADWTQNDIRKAFKETDERNNNESPHPDGMPWVL